MSETMMALGSYRFSVDTAAYQTLSRSAAYRWPAQERLTRHPALQFVGPGEQTIALEGYIHTLFRGGLGQLDALRAMGDEGEPLIWVDGFGNVKGKWVITQVEETQETFLPGGAPRKQTFTVNLQFYGEDAT